MPVEDLYPIVKRAYRTQIAGLKPYEPRAHDSLFGYYGFKYKKKRAMHKSLNDEFAEADKPLNPPLTPGETGEHDTVHHISKFIFEKRFGSVFPAVLMALLLSATLGTSVPALASVKLQDINKDGNPQVVSFEERRVYFANQNSYKVSDFDENRNGRIDQEELVKLNKAIDADTRRQLKDLFPGEDDGDEPTRREIALIDALERIDEELAVPPMPLTPAEIERNRLMAERMERQNYTYEDKFYLRRSGKDVTTWSGKLAADAASLGYKHDAVADVDSGKIEAAIGFLRKAEIKADRVPKTGPPYLSAYAIGGSVATNRTFDSRGSKFENNSLNFRAGGDLEYTLRNGSLHNLTGWLRYETDTDFKQKVLGVETIYSPYILSISPASKILGGLVVAVDFVPTVESDYAYVVSDPGGSIPYSEYLNLGFGARLEAAFRRNGRLLATFSSDYEHFWNVSGNSEQTYNWVNQLQIPLSANNHASLLISYENSDNGLLNSSKNEFSIGFGLKY